MFSGLQAVRFLAAAAIVLAHCLHYGARHAILPISEPTGFEEELTQGLIVFFVLSGFLMAAVAERESRISRFLVHRFARIYPPFLLAVLIAVLLHQWLQPGPSPLHSLQPLLLIPNGELDYPLGVEWTLVYEIFFYCVVALHMLLPGRRLRRAAILLWLAAIFLVDAWLAPEINTTFPTAANIAVSPLNGAFIMGMVGWWIHGRTRNWSGWLLALSLGLFALHPFVSQWVPGFLLAVFASLALILAAAGWPASGLLKRDSLLVRGGDASYGIYLLHVPLLVAIYPMLPQAGWLSFAAAFAFALGLGGGFGQLEFRFYHLLTKRLDEIWPRSGRRIPLAQALLRSRAP